VSGWLDFLIVLIINLAALKCPLRHLPPMHRALQFGLIVSAARTGMPSPLWFNAGEQVQPCDGFGATGPVFRGAHIQLTPPAIKAHEPGCEYAGSQQNVGYVP
jgi:hypothetical protein